MRIEIYASGLSESSGGVKVYIMDLIESIIKVKSSKDKFYIIYNLKRNIFEKKENVYEVILDWNSKIYCDFILAPRKINSLKLDLGLFKDFRK